MTWVSSVLCSKCGPVGSFSEGGVLFFYVSGDQEVPIDFTYGWCESCGCIRHVEKLTDGQISQSRVAEIQKEIDLLKFEIYKQERVFVIFRSRKRIRNCKQELNGLKGELQSVLRQLEISEVLRNRKSPPRCLECGESRIEYLVLPERLSSESALLGKVHRVCGGQLSIKYTAHYSNASASKVLVDVEGNIIKAGEFSDKYFEEAWGELEAGSPHKATWAKCITKSGGDQEKAKAAYIEMRVKSLAGD